MAARRFDYSKTAQDAEAAVRKAFPKAFVDVSEGYLGRVHLVVVSRDFDGLSEKQKQDKLWEVLKAELGRNAQAISLAMAWGVDELR